LGPLSGLIASAVQLTNEFKDSIQGNGTNATRIRRSTPRIIMNRVFIKRRFKEGDPECLIQKANVVSTMIEA